MRDFIYAPVWHHTVRQLPISDVKLYGDVYASSEPKEEPVEVSVPFEEEKPSDDEKKASKPKRKYTRRKKK